MATAQAKAGRREWIGLAVLSWRHADHQMDITVLYLAVPLITADLEPTSTQLLWITDVYGFVVAGLLIPWVRWGTGSAAAAADDGAAAFGAASVLTAFSTSPEMLIAARAVIGCRRRHPDAVDLSLIRNMFHDEQRPRRRHRLWAAGFSVGSRHRPVVRRRPAPAFLLGLGLSDLNVPMMLLLLTSGRCCCREFRDPGPGRFDLPAPPCLRRGAVDWSMVSSSSPSTGWTGPRWPAWSAGWSS